MEVQYSTWFWHITSISSTYRIDPYISMFRSSLPRVPCPLTQVPYPLQMYLICSHAPSRVRKKQLAQAIAEGGDEPTGDDAHRDDVTALMVAAQGGHEDVLRLLLERGADVRAKDEEGFSALLNAVKVRDVGPDGRGDARVGLEERFCKVV